VSTAPVSTEVSLAVAQQYFDAWNRRDSDGIVAAFADGGTYSDPSAGELSGPAIGGYAGTLFAAFPDLSFDLVSVSTSAAGEIVAEWVMCGMNSGPFLGAPPTGRTVALPGADFITIEDGKIRSVRGYFDQKAFVEQLGLQVIVQPREIGPFTFGVAAYASRDQKTTPGAFSITSIAARSEEEVAEIDNASFEIVSELMETPGFLSFAGVTVGLRGLTITAWESEEHAALVRRQQQHKGAMAKFFGSELAAGGVTSVWVPERINPTWVRCSICNAMTNADRADGTCSCGAALPDPPPFF
jgi:steroid delta-isomerase-like uncharacterized protein